MILYEIFRFAQASTIWTFTSGKADIIYDAGDGDEIYVPLTIERNDIQQKNEISKANLTVTIPIDCDLAVTILTATSENPMSVTVFSNIDGVTEVTWKGRVASFQPTEDEKLDLSVESIFTSFSRIGLRARFQKSCRHALYGRGCKLLLADFENDVTIDAISGNTLIVPEASGFDDGYFAGGIITSPDNSFLFVIGHSGTSIQVQRLNFSMVSQFAIQGPGMTAKIYPGCNKSRDTCRVKFDNLLNYGGFDHIPTKNPMGGSSIA